MFCAGDSGPFLSSRYVLREKNSQCIICNLDAQLKKKRKNNSIIDKYSGLRSGCIRSPSVPLCPFLALSCSSLSGVEGLEGCFPWVPSMAQISVVCCAFCIPDIVSPMALKTFWGFLSQTWAGTTQQFQTNPTMRLKVGTRRYPRIKLQVRAATETHGAGA